MKQLKAQQAKHVNIDPQICVLKHTHQDMGAWTKHACY